MSPSKELAMYDRIVRVLDRQNFDILVKPHPRDDPKKHDGIPAIHSARSVTRLSRDEPAEKLIRHLDTRDILIGVISNALFTGYALYGLQVYSFCKLAGEYGCARWLVDDMNRFSPAFGPHLRPFSELEGVLARSPAFSADK
jgi:hypothetical protein